MANQASEIFVEKIKGSLPLVAEIQVELDNANPK